MDLAYEYSKKRKEFGKHPKFKDSGAIEIVNILPNDEFKDDWNVRPSTTMVIDCIPSIAEHEVNTERYIAIHEGMQHKEGGWPIEINTEEFEDKKRYIRKTETDEEFNKALTEVVLKVEKCVKQNNSIDMFEEYFADDKDVDHSSEPPTVKTITIFKDPNKLVRPVSSICWHPENRYRIASLHCDLSFESMNVSEFNACLDSYLWDINNPNRPYYTINPVSPICCLSFNKKNSDSFVCGCYNGIIAVWDLRKSGNKCVESTVIEQTHKDPVYDVEWIQSRTGTEFVSVSTDGTIRWWDARKLGTGCTDSMQLEYQLDNDDNKGIVKYGGTSLEYRTDAGATKYLVGTEQGTIISVERKAKKDGDSQKQIKVVYGECEEDQFKHHGPVYALSRNYFVPKCILSVGDWMSRLWMEDVKTPILSTRYESHFLTGGVWSPSRPGVFFISKKNGELDIWDYYYKGQFEPVYSVRISEQYSLTDVKVSTKSDGKYVGIGCQDGSVTVIELCDSLYQSSNLNAEKQAITQLFDRETNREKTLQASKLAQKRLQQLLQKKKEQQSKEKNENPEKKG